MLITRETDYAFRCVVYLAQKGPRTPNDPPRTVAQISREMSIPQSFLAKILQRLVRHGVLASTRGIGGGCRLARPPGEISMLAVIEAIQERPGITECAARPGSCALKQTCVVHPIWDEINREVEALLRGKTIQDLLDATSPSS